MAAKQTKFQNTTLKVRIYPTAEQAELFDKTFHCCRYLWNKMLTEQAEFYAATDVHFLPTPAKYKKEAPFLKEVDSQALANVHQNLRRAFQKFFDQPEVYRHPVFKTKKREKNSYTTYRSTVGRTLYLTEDGIRLPKAGVVKANVHRRPLCDWVLKTATVSKSLTGHYFCSLLFEYETPEPTPVCPTPARTLGIQDSVTHFYVDSEGHRVDLPLWLKKSQRKLAEEQRKLSRMERGSKNYNQQLQKLRILHEKIANQRKDFIHKTSRRIANDWDAVCLRDSDRKALSQWLTLGNGMNGFGAFRICLQYKLERLGKPYILVDSYFPSAKTCCLCGHVHHALTPKERTWRCPSCGGVLSRDTNAARNLKAQGLAMLQQTQESRRSA